MHRTACAVVLGAVAIAAAPGLSGCGDDEASRPAASVETPRPITKPPVVPTPPPPSTAPLPAPSALTDVMARLTDPNVAGADKLGLVEYATAEDAASLDRFTKALKDGGFMPLSFEANDMTWAQANPGNVMANIVIKTSNRGSGGDFTFPMEFSPTNGTWQLTRQTADMLLKLGQEQTAPPTR